MAFFGLTIGYPLWKKFWQYFKSFGGALVGAKEVSKMLVLHEFLNLCASSQDLLQSRSFADLTCKHTIYQDTKEEEEEYVAMLGIGRDLMFWSSCKLLFVLLKWKSTKSFLLIPKYFGLVKNIFENTTEFQMVPSLVKRGMVGDAWRKTKSAKSFGKVNYLLVNIMR